MPNAENKQEASPTLRMVSVTCTRGDTSSSIAHYDCSLWLAVTDERPSVEAPKKPKVMKRDLELLLGAQDHNLRGVMCEFPRCLTSPASYNVFPSYNAPRLPLLPQTAPWNAAESVKKSPLLLRAVALVQQQQQQQRLMPRGQAKPPPRQPPARQRCWRG